MAENLKLRTLEIDIWCDFAWDISDNSAPDEEQDDCPDEEMNIRFGVTRLYRGKIAYIHQPGMGERHFRMAQEHTLLQEECIFTYPKEGVEFRGTFLDAFKFIKPRLDE